MLYIGVDLGTSAMKLLLTDDEGRILNTVSREYPLSFPRPGWSEQNPDDWAQALLEGIPRLLEGRDRESVAGIGVAGQMHGLVILDERDRVLRPAILWNDGRTEEQVEYLNGEVGREKLSEYTSNIAFAGFTAPKLLWVRQHEPEIFARIRKIMLPKDYLNYILTGVHSCDYSDASGMLLLDVKNKCWSQQMLDICGVKQEWMPQLFNSFACIGTLKPEIAQSLGLPRSVRVAAGAGDNAAAAIGTGTLGEGHCNISLGTSGTIFISMDRYRLDPCNALHCFVHSDGGYQLMGCMLSAASCNKWLMDEIYRTDDYGKEQTGIREEMLGRDPVFFLPYLMGERSPINDTSAQAMFVGMRPDTSREDMTQAVLEGVSFALRDSLEIARRLGIPVRSSTLCGGGARSPLWKKILANVLNIPLQTVETEQGPGLGAAMLAMVASGAWTDLETAASSLVRMAEIENPQPELVERYEQRYQIFREIYPACRPLFHKIHRANMDIALP